MNEEFWYWGRILLVIVVIIALFNNKFQEKRMSIISDIGEFHEN